MEPETSHSKTRGDILGLRQEVWLSPRQPIQQGTQHILKLPKNKGVYIESNYITDVYTMENNVIGQKKPNGVYEANLVTIKDGWEKE